MVKLVGTNLILGIVPQTDTDSYATHYSKYGQGGWKEVATIDERNAITNERKAVGMAVYVTDVGKLYILKDKENNIWEEFSSGSGGGGGGADLSNYYTKPETDSLLAEKADKSDLDNLLTTDNVYTKDEVYTKSEIDERVSTTFRYKGVVPTVGDLPLTDNQIGDVYNVSDTGANYAWDGTNWDKLSETIDLSGYVTKTELAEDLENVVRFTNDGVTEGRKGVILNNHDYLAGYDTDGTSVRILAMLSEFGVADFGSAYNHTNINTSTPIVTVNDTQAIITDVLLERILYSGQNVTITKTPMVDETTGFNYNAYRVDVDLEKVVTPEELEEIKNTISILNEELTQIKTDISAIEEDLDYITENKADKADLENIVKYTNDVVTEGRKGIILNNDDYIAGYDTDGLGVRILAMLSKYGVADFGSTKGHTNLNTQKIVTVQTAESGTSMEAVITDKLLEQILVAGENVTITKKDMTDPDTGFAYNAYEISVAGIGNITTLISQAISEHNSDTTAHADLFAQIKPVWEQI